MKVNMNDKKITVIICFTVCLWVLVTGFNNFKKVHGKGVCNVVNGIDDIKYVISQKSFVACEGECNINYKQSAINAFELYGDEFVILYCGLDKNELPSIKGE